MFWFPQPTTVDERVIGFLNFEKEYLTNGWEADKFFVLVAVVLFFLFLIYTIWQRKWKSLLWVVVLGALLKVIHSVIFVGGNGLSIVIPAVIGLAVLLICNYIYCHQKEKKLAPGFVEKKQNISNLRRRKYRLFYYGLFY